MRGTCYAIVAGETNTKHDVLFHVHNDNTNSLMEFHLISSRITAIRLRASPFNVTVVKVYAPTSRYDDE